VDDFYGAELKICLAGYLRDEKNFESIGIPCNNFLVILIDSCPVMLRTLCYISDDLKVAIHNDIEEAKKKLSLPEYQCLSQDSFFSDVKPNPKETTIPANDVITPTHN